MNQHSAELSVFLARIRRRILLIAASEGAAVGLVVGSIAGFVIATRSVTGDPRVIAAGSGLVGALLGAVIAIGARRKAHVAAEVERRAPESRNLILTAYEVIRAPERSTPYVFDLVTAQAAGTARSLDPSFLFPARGTAIRLGFAVVVFVAAAAAAERGVGASLPIIAGPRAGEEGSITVLITPPAYAKRESQTLRNPARIDAMAGSRIRITSDRDSVRAETLEGELPPRSTGPTVFELVAERDGFIAIHSGVSSRRLIGLTVSPDLAPRVRVSAPGKDMFLTDANRRIPVEVQASDDLGLASLALRYTKVSGSGERFTFVEGTVPVTLERASDREWRARGTIDLGTMQLEQGDMIVYRGVARDGRPAQASAESDAFIIEITSPGMIAAEGFSLDDQQDKYALSQQMVILKTERLIARATSLSPDSLLYYSQSLAAEQRAVRAEFVFMMGGEVAEEVVAAAGLTDIDETHEAENEGEIAAGRLVNRGRTALIEAIRQMSRASARLNDGDPRAALPIEKVALNSLQEAFSRTRYLLRALTLRERLDLSRRLTGVLALASRDVRPAADPEADPATVSLRRALAGIAALAGADTAPAARAEATVLAQTVLRVDPSDTTLQEVAAHLQEASRGFSEGRASVAKRALDEAANALSVALRVRMAHEAPDTESPELRRLRGALSEARRAGGAR